MGLLSTVGTQCVQYVALDHKTSLKSMGYICSNSPKYSV